MAEVAKALGVSTPTELAKAIKLEGYNSPQRVRRWMEGNNAPDYEGTMLMLEATGWLKIPKSRAAIRHGRALDERELVSAIDEITNVLVRLQRLVDEQDPPQREQRRRGA